MRVLSSLLIVADRWLDNTLALVRSKSSVESLPRSTGWRGRDGSRKCRRRQDLLQPPHTCVSEGCHFR